MLEHTAGTLVAVFLHAAALCLVWPAVDRFKRATAAVTATASVFVRVWIRNGASEVVIANDMPESVAPARGPRRVVAEIVAVVGRGRVRVRARRRRRPPSGEHDPRHGQVGENRRGNNQQGEHLRAFHSWLPLACPAVSCEGTPHATHPLSVKIRTRSPSHREPSSRSSNACVRRASTVAGRLFMRARPQGISAPINTHFSFVPLLTISWRASEACCSPRISQLM